jgi:parallel beta-helix repeat protein
VRKLLLGLLLVTIAGLGNAGAAGAQSAPPPCGVVTRSTTLTSDCTGPLVVAASGITVNLNGHTVSCGSPSNEPAYLATVGIDITNRTYVIVRDGTVTRCGTGVRIGGGGGHNVIRLNADRNGFCDEGGGPYAPGMRLEASHRNTIRDGSASFNGGGIDMRGSDYNVVVRQKVNDNCGTGIAMSGGSDRNVVDSTQVVGTWGFADGVVIEASEKNTVKNSRIHDSEYREGGVSGIVVRDSPSTWISSNIVTENETNGVLVTGNSAYSVVRGNIADRNARSNQGCGIAVRSTRVTVHSNTANENGALFGYPGSGICLHAGASSNVVRDNSAFDNVVFDLVDENAGCDANTWSGNRFGTANQPCIH